MAEQPPQPQPGSSQPAPSAPRVAPRPLAEDAKPNRRSRRRWRLILGIGLPLILIGGFLYYWFYMRPYESTDDAFIEGNVIPIAPQVSGRVTKLLVQDNEQVKEGGLLLQIDPRDYEARLAQAQAALVAARSRLEQAKAQVDTDRAKVHQEQASLSAAQSEAERAQADLKRYQAVQSQAVSRTQLDLAAAQARSTAAAVAVAQSREKAAEAQVVLSKAAVQTAQAEVERAQASVQEAQLELSYTHVKAPEAGFVTHRTVEAGTYVQPGQVLLALVPPRVWVVANFKETQLTDMKPGQPVQVNVDAYPDHSFPAHVDSIQRGSGARFSLLPPENASGNYVKVVQRVPVKIVFNQPPDPNLPLGPGMSVVPVVNVLAPGHRTPDGTAPGGAWTEK